MALHSSSNTPAGNLQSGARVALTGLVANAVLATAKIAAGLLGNSYVLIADGIESAPEAFLGLLKGRNFGKQLVKLV